MKFALLNIVIAAFLISNGVFAWCPDPKGQHLQVCVDCQLDHRSNIYSCTCKTLAGKTIAASIALRPDNCYDKLKFSVDRLIEEKPPVK